MAQRTSRTARRAGRVLTDPKIIRALAHPARLTVLEALSDGAELTATACAAEAGISASAMSYHLRALAKYGFVERVESSADGRERPWRATNPEWRVEAMPDPETADATAALTAVTFDRALQALDQWYAAKRSAPAEWRDVGSVHSTHAWLTSEEAGELAGLYEGFLAARKGRTANDHPDGARRVRLLRVLVPGRAGDAAR